MLRVAPVLWLCLIALALVPAGAQAACPETTPSYTSACGPPFTLPQWSDAGGWDKPSAYSTIQLAKLDGQPGEELIGRDSVGVWVERYDRDLGQWRMLGTPQGGVALAATDREGYGAPESYETMQFADLTGDGSDDLLVRRKDGLEVYRFDRNTSSFVEISTGPKLFSDSAGWGHYWYYQSIQTADIDGDGRAFVLARGSDGLHTYRWNAATGSFEQVGQTLTQLKDLPDEWYLPSRYGTIQTADIDGNGKLALLARGAAGLYTFVWTGDGWTQSGPVLTDLSEANGWEAPQYWQTIQTADVDGDGRAELLARGPSGLRTWKRSGDKWVEDGPILGAMSDANGFNKPDRYRTIQTADLDGNGRAELLARDGKGIVVWRRVGDAWTQISSGVPALTDDPWAAAQYYETIQTGDIDGDGHAELIARGPFGIRTFVWDSSSNTFRRPEPYGSFPAFTTEAEKKAYAALGELLLGRGADFRAATYASPNETITEATLDRYRGLLSERCTPAFTAQSGASPPRYVDCKPPNGDIDEAAWTKVTNQIVGELWAAAGVVAHFSTLDLIQTKLFQDSQGSLPALDAQLKLPADVPDRAPTFIKLVKAGLEILGDIAQLTPIGDTFKKTIRGIALTAHALGAIGEGLGLKSTPDPPQSWAKITDEVARIQQRERDITEAQRRYALADYGLLMTVGSLVNGRLWTLDTTAMLSAGRQSFTTWAYQLYTPAFWKRFDVSGCRTRPGVNCDIPTGTNVRVRPPSSFVAILNKDSGCRNLFPTCWWTGPGEIGNRTWGAISDDCRYDPAPGSTNAWRYGCNLGAEPADLFDQKNGWVYTTTVCVLPSSGPCTDKPAKMRSAEVTENDDGTTDLTLVASVPGPGPGVKSKPDPKTIQLVDLIDEPDGAGELVDGPGGLPITPLTLKRQPGGGYAAVPTTDQPRVTARLARVGRGADERVQVTLHVQHASLQAPDACAGHDNTRVTLETRLGLAFSSAPATSIPIDASWVCKGYGLALAQKG